MSRRRTPAQVAEAARLDRLTDEFNQEMRDRLKAKQDQGFTGWRRKGMEADMMRRLRKKAEAGPVEPIDYVDIANFAAFLFWHARKRQEARQT